MEMIDGKVFEIVQDVDKAILVMRDAGKWIEESGKEVSKWWSLENLNRDFLLKYAKSDEFYVGLADDEPVVAAIIQFEQSGQDWKYIDGERVVSALYIHWLCVAREYAGKAFLKTIVDFAERMAAERGVDFLRADTNAGVMKLRKVYEDLGFDLVSVKKEDYRQTAFYHKVIR